MPEEKKNKVSKKTDDTKEVKKVVKKTAAKKVVAKKTETTKAKAVKKEATVKKTEEQVESKIAKGGSFIPSVGRRKTAVARVRLIKNGKGEVTVNGKKFDEFFTVYALRVEILAPLKAVGQDDAVDISVKVLGGGIRGQAEAVRHGIARSLIVLNPTFRKTLKKLGYLSRDPRKKERKKPGLRGARRATQWSKR